MLHLALAASAVGDTLTNLQTGEVLHGYVTNKTQGANNIVQTVEKGQLELNLAQWSLDPDRHGRSKKVVIIPIATEIMLELTTEAIENSIARAADEGALAIIFEIDTPGGRVDLAQRISSAITQTKHCQTIAFIKGGLYGGAISAGAAVSLSCDKIYMANNTSIGAATVVSMDETGIVDIKEKYGEDVGEKLTSRWRAYLASLAEQSNRPSIIARAMVDKDIEVVEVAGPEKNSFFVDPVNVSENQRIIKTWSKKNSLLTLTAEEAYRCGIADRLFSSRQQLLQHLNFIDAEIVIDEKIKKAQEEFDRAQQRILKLRKSLDLSIKELEQTRYYAHALKLVRSIQADFKFMISNAKRYPDLGLSVEVLEEELNSVEAFYKKIKMDSARR
jgi:membrane-bound ClpP family serine protease